MSNIEVQEDETVDETLRKDWLTTALSLIIIGSVMTIWSILSIKNVSPTYLNATVTMLSGITAVWAFGKESARVWNEIRLR
jgi:hypothetical protein